MRKLLELVMIMVFCVSMASGSTIMLISDSGHWPIGASSYEFLDADGNEEFQDSPMVAFLEGLGYTVDTSGMAGAYRETQNWTTDPVKVAALNAADLIIVSRVTSSGSYDNDRDAWNELAVPLLCQNVHILRSGGKWGWFNGSVAYQNGGALNMDIVMGHELVDGFSDPVTVYTSIPANPWNPRADAVWDSRTSVIGTYEGVPMLVDIPTGTDFDVLCGTTNYYGINGARRVYLGIYTYDNDYWNAGLSDDYKDLFAQAVYKTMNSTVEIVNDLPAHNATDISRWRTDSENDLVFTILDPNVVEVDIYLDTEGDPNLASNSENLIEHITSVTAGQYTVDLNTLTLPSHLLEVDGHLKWYRDYYWKVIGYEPNAITSIPEPATAGPTWQFQTEPDAPIISGVSPEITAAFVGDPNVIFSVVGINIETYQWYKDGVGALSNGTDYSGVDTDTLVINDIDTDDVGSYYCVGTKAEYDDVTSVPYGKLDLKELKHHFPFESATSNITLDIIGAVQAQLIGGASVEPNGVNSIIGGYLQLDNPEATEYDSEYATILDDVADYPEITISAWVRQDTRDIGCVWDFGENQNNYFTFTPGYQDGVAKPEFRYQIEGTQYQDEYEVAYDRTGDWQFIAVTLDSEGQSKTYIDGEFKDSANLADDATDDGFSGVNLTIINKTTNYIGHRIYPSLPKFDGLIDELKIYNYLLSDVQIAQEYTDVMGGYVCTEDYDLGVYDYDHNCRVDLIDIAEFATRWLEHDRIYRP